MQQAPVAQVDYSSEQLDALALVFTAAKLLFIGGALGRVRRLAAAAEPARRAARRPLHQTMVRNEAAYFGCVAQLLAPPHAPPPAPAPGLDARPLYLLGDSHCLSGGPSARQLPVRSRLLLGDVRSPVKITRTAHAADGAAACSRPLPRRCWRCAAPAPPPAVRLLHGLRAGRRERAPRARRRVAPGARAGPPAAAGAHASHRLQGVAPARRGRILPQARLAAHCCRAARRRPGATPPRARGARPGGRAACCRARLGPHACGVQCPKRARPCAGAGAHGRRARMTAPGGCSRQAAPPRL